MTCGNSTGRSMRYWLGLRLLWRSGILLLSFACWRLLSVLLSICLMTLTKHDMLRQHQRGKQGKSFFDYNQSLYDDDGLWTCLNLRRWRELVTWRFGFEVSRDVLYRSALVMIYSHLSVMVGNVTSLVKPHWSNRGHELAEFTANTCFRGPGISKHVLFAQPEYLSSHAVALYQQDLPSLI